MRRRGHTLPEVMLAALLFAIITTLMAMGTGTVRTALLSRDSRLECARASRDVLMRLSTDLRQAGYIFAGYTGTVDGHSYLANELLFAVPDSSTTYRVAGLYAQPMSPADPRNPAAQELVYYERSGVAPAKTEQPQSLVLGGLSQGRRRRYRCYLAPGTLRTSVGAGNAVTLEFWTARLPERGGSLLERRLLTIWPRLSQ